MSVYYDHTSDCSQGADGSMCEAVLFHTRLPVKQEVQ
jgi:hypothetical protein